MKGVLAFAVLATVSGCSLLNAPDRDYGPPDATTGPDAGSDTGLADAGPDTAMHDGDVPDCVRTGVEVCRDGLDEDCDGLVDCRDFECTRSSDCCTMGDQVISNGTGFPMGLTGWTRQPAGMGPTRTATGALQFGGAVPQVLMRNECSPMIRGLTVDVTFNVVDVCAPASCTDYGSLVLTAANDVVEGNTLMDDLEVRIRGDGSMEVRVADRVVDGSQREPADVGASAQVLVEIAPGTNARGTAVLFATITLNSTDVLVAEHEFMLQSQLLSDPARCLRGRGLNVAFEGVGTRAQVASVTANERTCANPSHFTTPPGGPIDHTTFPLPWASGGIGAPGLASYRTGPGATDFVFQTLVDGTNTQRSNELFAHVGYSIGGGMSANGITIWDRRNDPGNLIVVGQDPPQPDGIEPGESVREPSLLPVVGADGMLTSPTMYGAYSQEEGEDADPPIRDIFAIRLFNLQVGVDSALSATTSAPFVTPASTGCTSLRDPLLLPRSATPVTDGFWLFYTCVSPLPAPPRIEAIQVDGLGATTVGDPAVVLDGSTVGSLGVKGVYGAEGVWRIEGTGAEATLVLRLWFLATDARGTTTIAMAQSETPVESAQLYPFQPYPGNPVLRASDLVLGSCSGSCFLEGLAATQIAGVGDDVRLLVARSVNDLTGTRYELVPLEQFWR